MKIRLVDLHNDMLTVKDEKIVKTEYDFNEKSGYKSIYALYKGERNLSDIKEIYKKARNLNVKNFAFEDACYNEKEASEEFIAEVKPLYASLCWNNENDYASGALSAGGVKSKGYRFIEFLNENGIPLDLAHANRRTFFEAADKAERILCSHTSFVDVLNRPRNIDGDQISLLLERNGLIGVCFVGYFLTGSKDVKQAESAFYELIDGYLQKYGAKGLAIGSDFYGSDYLAFRDCNDFLCSFTERFFRSGGDEKTYNAILYENALKFYGEALV